MPSCPPLSLSSESWSIMKNMATELGIVLVATSPSCHHPGEGPPGLQLGPRGPLLSLPAVQGTLRPLYCCLSL